MFENYKKLIRNKIKNFRERNKEYSNDEQDELKLDKNILSRLAKKEIKTYDVSIGMTQILVNDISDKTHFLNTTDYIKRTDKKINKIKDINEQTKAKKNQDALKSFLIKKNKNHQVTNKGKEHTERELTFR